MKNNKWIILKVLKTFVLMLLLTMYFGCSSLINLSGFPEDQLISNPKTAGYLAIYNTAMFSPIFGGQTSLDCQISINGTSYGLKLGDKIKYRYFVLKPGTYTIYSSGEIRTLYQSGKTFTGETNGRYNNIIKNVVIQPGNTTSIEFSFGLDDRRSLVVLDAMEIKKNMVYDIKQGELKKIK